MEDMWTLRSTRDYELYNLSVLITQRNYFLFIDNPRWEDEPPVFSHVINRSEASLEEAQELLVKVVDNYRNYGVWAHPDDVEK